MNSGQKKGINFDLDTNALKIHYTKRTGVRLTVMSGTFLRKMALNISRAQDIIPLCRCQNLM